MKHVHNLVYRHLIIKFYTDEKQSSLVCHKFTNMCDSRTELLKDEITKMSADSGIAQTTCSVMELHLTLLFLLLNNNISKVLDSHFRRLEQLALYKAKNLKNQTIIKANSRMLAASRSQSV